MPKQTVWTSALSVPKEDDTRTYPQMILSISYVRDGDGMQEPCVRSVWTYARGSRACYGACAQMVEMFSSLYLFFIFSCISFVSEYSFHKTDCKGSLFPSIHQSFLLFMQHFFCSSRQFGTYRPSLTDVNDHLFGKKLIMEHRRD